MISRVVIKNFKSIGEPGVDLELKPLTLLVGPNGGGKSSILEAIAVAAQGNYSGKLTTFTSFRSIVHKESTATLETNIYFVYPDILSPDTQSKPGFRISFNAARELSGENIAEASVTMFVPEVATRLRTELNRNSFLMNSTRGNVPYTTNTGSDPEWVGVHGENLLLLLAKIFGQRLPKDTADSIRKWAGRFGIGDLYAGPRGANLSGSDYADTVFKVVLDLALASPGSRQILTVITQLFWAPEGSLLMIEEPEISLHPKAQIDVLEMFAEAIGEKKQIIATSHSVILLQALGYAVLKGWLTPEQMAVYHVEKGEKGTTATLLPLDEHGYVKDWIPSFTEVERQLIREWAKSVPRE